MGGHHTALGQSDTNVLHANEVVQQEVHAGIRQRGIAHGRPDSLELLLVQLGNGQLLVGCISPIVAPHFLVHPLGGGLCQTVGQCLDKHAAERVVLVHVLSTVVGARGKEPDTVADARRQGP